MSRKIKRYVVRCLGGDAPHNYISDVDKRFGFCKKCDKERRMTSGVPETSVSKKPS